MSPVPPRNRGITQIPIYPSVSAIALITSSGFERTTLLTEATRAMRLSLTRFTYSTDMMEDFIRKAVTPDDIILAKKENRHALYFSGNGVPIPQDWVSVEEELRFIRVFFQLGIRMMHLTYNRRNMIGDGCGEPGNAG